MQRRSEKIDPTFFAKRKSLKKRNVYRIAIGMMEANDYQLFGEPVAPVEHLEFVNLCNQDEGSCCEYARLYKDKNGEIHIIYFPGTDVPAKQRIADNSGDIDLETVKTEALKLIRVAHPELDLAKTHQHFFIAESLKYESIPVAAKHYVYGYLHNHELTIEDSTNLLKYNTTAMVQAISQGEDAALKANPTIQYGDQSVWADTCGHFVTEYFLRNVRRIENKAGVKSDSVVITDQKLIEAAFYHQQHSPTKYKTHYEDQGFFARHYIWKNILLFSVIALGIGGIAVAAVSSFGLLPTIALIVGAAVGGTLFVTGGGLKLIDVFRRCFKRFKLKKALSADKILDDGDSSRNILNAVKDGKGSVAGQERMDQHNCDSTSEDEDGFCVIAGEVNHAQDTQHQDSDEADDLKPDRFSRGYN